MIKKFLLRKSAKKIASNYSSYTEFAHKATDDEKQKVIIKALAKANKLQQRVASTQISQRDGNDQEPLDQLDRFMAEFDTCRKHVKADITIGEKYDYGQVLQAIKEKMRKSPSQ